MLNIAITGSNFVLSILLVEFPGHVLVDNNISRLVDTLRVYVGKTSNHRVTTSLFTRKFSNGGPHFTVWGHSPVGEEADVRI